jgi:curli biogenesis system outer membrane secretion channel CsgG
LHTHINLPEVQLKKLLFIVMTLLCVPACSAPVETQQAMAVNQVASVNTTYNGPRYPIVVGQFENKTQYHKGIFYEGKDDQVGHQAKQILKTHLVSTNRFTVMDRWNLEQIKREAEYAGQPLNITAGKLVISGAVTEFGRRETGGEALGGVLGGSRTQSAYAKISVSIIDVNTSQIVFAAQGAGQTNLTNEQVLGFGSKAGYDATLTDKVLNLAMIEVVNRLVEGLESGKIVLPGQ